MATDEEWENALKSFRLKYPGTVRISQVSIKLLRNKFDSLREIAWDKVDVLIVFDSKVDSSFS